MPHSQEAVEIAFGQQLMITLYDMAAATVYSQAWLAPENQWVFKGLPAEIPTIHGQGSIGPALSVRAHGEDERKARYDSASRTAIIRVGSLTWTGQQLMITLYDLAAATSLHPGLARRGRPVDLRRPAGRDPLMQGQGSSGRR